MALNALPALQVETPNVSGAFAQGQANALTRQRSQQQLRSEDLDFALQQVKVGRQELAAAVDEPSYQRVRERLSRMGIPTDDMPPTFDPGYRDSELQALLTAEQRLDMKKRQLFQQDNRLLAASPYTGEVELIYEGPQAPPKPVEPVVPKPMSDYERESLRLREMEVRQRGSKPPPAIKQSEGAKIADRERAKAEAKRPQATAAYNTATNEIDRLIEDLTTLKNDPGVEGITGLVYGRTPGVTAQARRAEALFDKIMAKGQFRALQDLRNASPTGGALGQITDKENAALRASFGALDRKQATADFKANIDKVISDLQFSRGNIAGAFNDTYGESAGAPAAGSFTPVAGAGGLSPEEQAELEELRKRFGRK